MAIQCTEIPGNAGMVRGPPDGVSNPNRGHGNALNLNNFVGTTFFRGFEIYLHSWLSHFYSLLVFALFPTGFVFIFKHIE